LTQGPANIWSLNPVELHSHREAGQTHASTVEMGISE
jgi:hypothetical protein